MNHKFKSNKKRRRCQKARNERWFYKGGKGSKGSMHFIVSTITNRREACQSRNIHSYKDDIC